MSINSATPAHADPDVRPIVRTAPASNRSLWIFAGIVVVAAALLFQALTARREHLAAPATQAMPSAGGVLTAPPPLALPPQFQQSQAEPNAQILPPALLPQRPLALPAAPRVITRIVERQAPAQTLSQVPQQPLVAQPAIIEARPQAFAAPPAQPTQAVVNDRVVAGHLRNPSLTVPQGTVIAAVLETALDSTRPGGARAIVQRDVMGFDGTRVLIPRGSRLYGEYGADVGAGQKRALIRWTRLTRPDAVIVNIDSPSADPLGRAGVEGKVNSHFFERFGGAILQSVLDIGVGLATSSAFDHGIYVALPGAAQAVPNIQPQQVKPTLKVRQGTSVSVFVARDLDFSTVDQ